MENTSLGWMLEAIHVQFNVGVVNTMLISSHAGVGDGAYLYCPTVRDPWSVAKSKANRPIASAVVVDEIIHGRSSRFRSGKTRKSCSTPEMHLLGRGS